MKYYRYFEYLLGIEEALASYMKHLQFTGKTESLFSPELSLLLLQTCPVIESYMVQLCIDSATVKRHPLYNWEYAYKLWDREKGKIKKKGGKRQISTFPKFSYVIDKIFEISSSRCVFYYSDKFQNLDGNGHFSELKPYAGLKGFVDYKEAVIEKRKQFPTGIETPKWWTAYNKIKHDLDEAENRVTYGTVIEALGGLFVLLGSCDPDIQVLQENGYLTDGKIKTLLFEMPAISEKVGTSNGA